MFKFILKLLVFFSPLLLLYIFPLYVYWQGREFYSLPHVLEAQSGTSTVLFGLAYDYTERTYKRELVTQRNPTLIVLGTSRGLGIHSVFFNDPDAFANAGNGVKNIQDLIPFMQSLPKDNRISTVILELEPWWIGSDQVFPHVSEQLTLGQRLKLFFSYNWRTVYIDYTLHKFSLAGLADSSGHTPSIGLEALVDEYGFLNDGSHLYGGILQNPDRLSILQDQIDEVVSASTADRTTLEYGTTTPQKSFDSLQGFLDYCKQHGIHVAAFIPPYPQAVYDALIDPHDAYSEGAQNDWHAAEQMLISYGNTFFNFSNPHSAGIQPTEFIDNQHATDKAALRMLIVMAEGDPTLKKYVDLPALQTLLASTTGDAIMTILP